MVHAITFTDPATGTSWNTRDDWGLALQTQPTFSLPEQKTRYLDMPGGNGVIDLSAAITGYPVYGNRQGSFTFAVKDSQSGWQSLIHQLAGILHGQYVRIVLDDDPGWYCEGRAALEIGECSRQHATVVISYNVGPYAWAITATNEPWLWDPFSFETGVIGNGTFTASFSASESVTDTAAELAYTAQETGIAFFFPTFAVTGDNDVTLEIRAGDEVRKTVTLEHGESASVPRLALTEGRWLYKLEEVRVYASTASGTATLGVADSIIIQNGDTFGHISVTTTPAPLAFTATETGDAPVQVAFMHGSSLNDVTLTLTRGSTTVATIMLYNGRLTTVPGLVLYRGTWLYNGQPVTATLSTASGTATLQLRFRQGRL